ncbi:MAG: metallophosphoesterase family protein [Clostridiales bacterium]|nr:metallophosphoesterase family protein [Clostridiales bacterium]
MDRVLIDNWNRKVRPEDEVYILGDVTMKGAEFATEKLLQLNGTLYLVKGNHDRFADSPVFDTSLFEWIRDYYELEYKNERFILFHYPIEEWNHYFRHSYHLHGHQHNHMNHNLENREGDHIPFL